MKLALECPTFLLPDVQPLSDFDWILAHKVLRDREYASYYRVSKRFKVLDNSVNELLQPCSLEDMKEAAEIVKPDLVVAPDYLGDLLLTKESLINTVREYRRDRIMPVIQGRNSVEVLNCLDYILDLGFTEVAVPYDILSSRKDPVTTMASNRKLVVNRVINKTPIGFKIHLLGMTTLEELEDSNSGWVESIDTGAPVLYGLEGKRFGRDGYLPKTQPTLNRMEPLVTGEFPEYKFNFSDIYYNIAYLRRVKGY